MSALGLGPELLTSEKEPWIARWTSREGLAFVVIVALLGWFVFIADGNLKAMRVTQDTQQKELSAHYASMSTAATQLQVYFKDIGWLLYLECDRNAKTVVAHETCWAHLPK